MPRKCETLNSKVESGRLEIDFSITSGGMLSLLGWFFLHQTCNISLSESVVTGAVKTSGQLKVDQSNAFSIFLRCMSFPFPFFFFSCLVIFLMLQYYDADMLKCKR